MVWVHGEAERVVRPVDELAEERQVGLDHGAADLADQVAVGGRAEVVGGRALPGMVVLDDADALELLEDPLDGGRRHVGALGLDGTRELVRGPVSAVLGEDLEQQALGRGDPSSRRTERGEYPVEIP